MPEKCGQHLFLFFCIIFMFPCYIAVTDPRGMRGTHLEDLMAWNFDLPATGDLIIHWEIRESAAYTFAIKVFYDDNNSAEHVLYTGASPSGQAMIRSDQIASVSSVELEITTVPDPVEPYPTATIWLTNLVGGIENQVPVSGDDSVENGKLVIKLRGRLTQIEIDVN